MRSLALLLMTIYSPITVHQCACSRTHLHRHPTVLAGTVSAVQGPPRVPPAASLPRARMRQVSGVPHARLQGLLKALDHPQFGFTVLKSAVDGRVVTPDPGHPEDMNVVCATLSRTDCRDWRDCCQASLQCCDRQINMQSHRDSGRNKSVANTSEVNNNNHCPMTWDGYSCVDSTPAGQTVHFQCPGFLKRFSPVLNGKANKRCLDNSTWYVGAVGLEWTNYDSCYVDYDHHTILKLKLSFLGFSIALLIPSIAIFSITRPLRSQVRIKLHINLFVSLALSGLCSLLWEALVSESIMTDSAILHHQVTCKVLNIMSRSSLMSTFFWMFCEGVYLTWIMFNSLRHISSMTFFYFVGWGMPLLITVVYTVVRITIKNDERCWLADAGRLEWIIDGPTVACIAINFLFLLAIMRVMLRQLRTHREDRPLVVRSLRAMLILVPLFGLQQFFIIYRPQPLTRDSMYTRCAVQPS
ncbi:calcitonin gene-related peptide type 1 receptor-like isoform X1 [Pomacea canaliculata]|uniref:calcitonin gene-related peptide type 1 receptor-like isoform X1 n=2 Tax=Pomacea canaliculata TaxID=400727 RepID=UPI000D732C01|nr:calcitonin gene-related peptide type 1 receptor-like isoform X1 [Pomacea canaliculata]